MTRLIPEHRNGGLILNSVIPGTSSQQPTCLIVLNVSTQMGQFCDILGIISRNQAYEPPALQSLSPKLSVYNFFMLKIPTEFSVPYTES